ncbi:MAG TPA: Holliday junction branch migration protein RuvA [Phycisphaerae bacterium]|jgi:Holliday junction DNA helicase RuvA
MIVRLTGIVAEVGEESAVIDRDGLSYEVLVPRYAIGELAACRGRQVSVHTLEFLEGNTASGSLVPRMVGFLYPEDKLFFTRFISVKGIGPRKALRALAHPAGQVAGWIESGDVKSLKLLPGIGARAADQIIAELRGKLKDLAVAAGATREPVEARLNDDQRVALQILLEWGDARHEAERWLERAAQLHPELSGPDEWVRAAYRVKTGAE